VLHAFQKKAKKGVATPRQDLDLIKSRLRDAELHYRGRVDKGGRKP
jgi:phage-related protein